MELCSILRLARALYRNNNGTTRILKVELTDNSIIIYAAAYSELGPKAEKVARARHLLERTWERPVIIRNAETADRSLQLEG